MLKKYNMKKLLFALLVILACAQKSPEHAKAQIGGSENISTDSIPLNDQHAKIIPGLLAKQAQLEAALRENNDKLMILITAYAEPEKVIGFSQDQKKIIIKK